MFTNKRGLILPIGVPILVPALLLAKGPGPAITAWLVAGYAVAFGIDNLVVVSPYVRQLSTAWRRIAYRTVGLVVALLVQLALPLFAGALLTGNSPGAMFTMLVTAPGQYSAILMQIHPEVAAFGAAFMALASMWTLTDDKRKHLWIVPLETFLGKHSRLWRTVTLTAAAGISIAGAFHYSWPFAAAGFMGIGVFFAIDFFKNTVEGSEENAGNGQKKTPFWRLLALIEAIEAVFSLDTGIGALSLSSDVIVIITGLLAGILLMRSLNVRLSQAGRLSELVYLEAGAYWTMLLLAAQLIVGLVVDVPDWLVMSASTAIIGAAAAHSGLRLRKTGERSA